MAALDLEHQKGEKAMTKKEKQAFREGVEEGFVRAAELSGDPDKILRQFRLVSPVFDTNVTGRRWAESAK